MSEEEIEESLEIINKWLKKNYPITEEELGDNEFIAKDLEIERLNNIINDFEEELERESNIKEEDTCLEHNTFIDIRDTLKKVLKRFRELKGSDKE